MFYNWVTSLIVWFTNRVELVSNFSSNNKKPIQREIKKKDEVPDIARDTSFEPRVILNMLKAQRNELFPIEGRQEDAEEFLSFILNKMNDEMIEVSVFKLTWRVNLSSFFFSSENKNFTFQLKKLVTKPKEEETDDLNGNLETSENEEEWQVSIECLIFCELSAVRLSSV